MLASASLAPAAPTLVHAPDGCVLGCQVRPGSRCVWNKVGDLNGERESGMWPPRGRRSRVHRGGLRQLSPITLMAVTEVGASLQPPWLRRRLLSHAAPIRPRAVPYSPVQLHIAPRSLM